MKLIKKIAAIMFAFIMVVSMSCNVKADDTTTATEKGTITINKAIDGQTYTIYKLLDLESYVPETATQTGLYSYKPAAEWKSFFETAEAKKYITVDKNGYANWVKGANQAEFAQEALDYATANNISNKGTKPASNNTVKFEHLDLGYYLVDSSVGSLCVLNTTNPDLTIAEKNGVPSVEKGVSNTQNGTYGTSNNASIGDTVYFKTTITAQAGAKNYVLHDTMTNSLTFNNDVKVTYNGAQLSSPNDYTVSTSNIDNCTFEITFTESFLNKLTANSKIYVTYSAAVNDNAVVKVPMTNKTHLTYGDNNIETNKPETTTKTFEIPVFKYTGTNTPLKDAQFILSTDPKCEDKDKVLKFKLNAKNKYRYNKTDGNIVLTSLDTGRIDIEGLKAGTYYLKETAAPKGYNKLASAIKVTIKDDGTVQVEKDGALTDVTQVDVENKTGKVLPSTGGAGTTMIYLIGAVLVLGSGVVLATKRRVKGK